MGLYIIKIKDKYFEWTTVSDGPMTWAMTLDELKEYYLEEYGRQEFERLFEQRMARVEAKGNSSHGYDSVEQLVRVNCAGKDGTVITVDQIYEFYQNEETYKNLPVGRKYLDVVKEINGE